MNILYLRYICRFQRYSFPQDDEGSKRKMSAVFKQMAKLGYDTDTIWVKIERLVSKTLIAVAGELKVELQAAIPAGKPGPSCFQV